MATYYDELGVSKGATSEEIRAAFRRKAKKLHPDKKGGDADAMARANRAYETLSNPQRRLTYDRTGQDGTAPVQDIPRNLVLQQIMTWLNSDHNSGDMMKDIRDRMHQEQVALLQQMTIGSQKAERLRKRLKRMKFRGKGIDFVRVSVDHEIANIEHQVERLKDQSAHMDKAKEILKAYEYEPVWAGNGG